MVILIAGASHTGKTAFAQKLLEKYKYPYLSIDHLKMGLIRSGNTALSPLSDDRDLTAYLWNIVKEIVKTVVENKQNLVIEGCYIPFDWEKDFPKQYLSEIRYCCLIMSEKYIRSQFSKIMEFSSVIEKRVHDDCEMESLLVENARNLELAKARGLRYIMIDGDYSRAFERIV